MAWTFVGGQIETGTTNSPPSGAQADDLLICEVTNTSSSASVTPPAGWTEVASDPANSDFSQRVFRRVMQAGDTSWTWSWTAGTQKQTTVAIRGADTTAPIDVAASQTQGGVNTGNTPSTTPSATGEFFVGIWCMDASGGRTWTEDASLTEQIDGGGGTTLVTCVATEELADASAVTRGATISGTAQDIGSYGIVLKAAAGGGGESHNGSASTAITTATTASGSKVSAGSAATGISTSTTAAGSKSASGSASSSASVMSTATGHNPAVAAVARTRTLLGVGT